MTRRVPTRGLSVATGLMLLLGMTACSGGDSDATSAGDGPLAGATITVGSKEFPEQLVLGQITRLALENAGATVKDQTNLKGSATVREALVSGQIDTYWEYTGTAWVNFLDHTAEDAPTDLFPVVAAEDADNGIAWLEPAKFENSYGIAAKRDFSEKNDVTRLSDIAKLPDEASMCTSSEFRARDDGLAGVSDDYGIEFAPIVEFALDLIYTQIGESCNYGVVLTTDPRIITNDLVLLEDDQKFFVNYAGAVTLRQETLDEYPAIADVMAPISAALTNDVITGLNGQVANDGEEPEDVAHDWLESEGFIG